MVNEHALFVKAFFQQYGHPQHFGKIDAVLLLFKSKGKCVHLFTINQNDVDVRFDGCRKYIIQEGNDKVSMWKDGRIVYAKVI